MQEHNDDCRERGVAPPESSRPAKMPDHSPIRWPLCPDRACRRNRRCVVPAAFCANKRLSLRPTPAQQASALARFERRAKELIRQQREAMQSSR